MTSAIEISSPTSFASEAKSPSTNPEVSRVLQRSVSIPELAHQRLESHFQEHPQRQRNRWTKALWPGDCGQFFTCAIGTLAVTGVLYSLLQECYLPAGGALLICACCLPVYGRTQCLAEEADAARDIENVLPLIAEVQAGEKSLVNKFRRAVSAFCRQATEESAIAQERYATLERNHADTCRLLEATTTQLDVIQTSLQSSQQRLEQVEQENHKLAQIVETFIAEKTVLSLKIQEMEANEQALRAELINMERQLAAATTKAEDINKTFSNQIRGFSEQNDALQQRIQGMITEKEALQSNNEDLKHLIAEAHQQEDKTANLLRQVQQVNHHLAVEIQQLTAQVQRLETQKI